MDWPFKRKPNQHEIERAKRAQADRLDTILQNGSEEEFVEMAKAADPSITPEKLLALIEHYRKVRRGRAHGA